MQTVYAVPLSPNFPKPYSDWQSLVEDQILHGRLCLSTRLEARQPYNNLNLQHLIITDELPSLTNQIDRKQGQLYLQGVKPYSTFTGYILSRDQPAAGTEEKPTGKQLSGWWLIESFTFAP